MSGEKLWSRKHPDWSKVKVFHRMSNTVPKQLDPSRTYVVTTKLDGIRVHILNRAIMSKNGYDLTPFLPNVDLPPEDDLVYDAELVARPTSSHRVMKQLRKQGKGLELVYFDVRISQKPYEQRLEALQDLKVVPYEIVTGLDFEQINKKLARVQKKGHEGLVVRRADSFYPVTGRRNGKLSFKVKDKVLI